MIHISSDWSAVEHELSRLSDEPSMKTRMDLAMVLDKGVELVMGAIHVETGSLKGSVDGSDSYTAATKTWRGTIDVGGASPGPLAPVDYAIYEQRRGGAHDFMEVLRMLHPMWIAAIKKGLAP